MKKIKILKVIFDGNLKPSEVPALRGAIVEKVGRKNVLFHNHLEKGFRYKYPLIQYKTILGKPALICLDEGVDEIHKYFNKKDWDIFIGDKKLTMKIHSLSLDQFDLDVSDDLFKYRIHNWIALNQKNNQSFKRAENLVDRILILEKALTGNIISFAKGINWDITKKLQVKIIDQRYTNPVNLSGNTLIGFNVDYSANAFLPNHIGLGKGVSKGFGTVNRL